MALPTTILSNGQIPTNPLPLGIITVGTHTTAVQLIHNFTDLAGLRCERLFIEALHGNATGKMIFVLIENGVPPWTLPGGGGTTSGADTTNFLNVIKELGPGETYEVPAYMMNEISLDRIWIDSDTDGLKCIATAFFA